MIHSIGNDARCFGSIGQFFFVTSNPSNRNSNGAMLTLDTMKVAPGRVRSSSRISNVNVKYLKQNPLAMEFDLIKCSVEPGAVSIGHLSSEIIY